MKKFFTIIPLQIKGNLETSRYEAIGNERLSYPQETHFPIIPCIRGYLNQGESYEVIAVYTADNESCLRNLEVLREELSAVDEEFGSHCALHTIEQENSDLVTVHLDTFQKLINLTADEDNLFACMTFGTKPTVEILLSAIQYSYQIHENVMISCVVYGKMDHATKQSQIYDMTALVQMNQIVRLLAERKVKNPQETLRSILNL